MDIVKNILGYWFQQICEKTFYLIIVVIVSLIFLYCSNPYGRYMDAWLSS